MMTPNTPPAPNPATTLRFHFEPRGRRAGEANRSAGLGFHLLALVVLLGCATQPNLPREFSFITTKTTLQQVIDRVGPYSSIRGSGLQYYQFDRPDGSAVLVLPEWPFQPTNTVRRVSYHRYRDEITLRP